MSLDKLKDRLLTYITENGETGVNELAKACEVPLSTLQRYLEKQTYFRKTINRKWDIPGNVDTDIKSNTMTLMVNSVENALLLLNAQLSEIQSSVQNALMPVNTLKRAVDTISLPVAGDIPVINHQLSKLDEKLTSTTKAISAHIKNVPEMYQEMLKNLDIYRLVIELGMKFLQGDFNEELMLLLTKQSDTLSEDTIEIIKEYQLGT